MKVQCPACKKICHETTDTYDPDVIANGSMVALIDPWKSWGWGTFGNNCAASVVLASELFCPSCDGLLAPGGRLMVIETKDPEPSKTDRIRELLQDPGLTQSEISKMVGTTPQYVSRIKNDKS